MEQKTFYITTPVYYPSGKLHIGNCYTTIAADVIAKYKRLQGYDVLFLTGTDEHGLKVPKYAKEGVTPKEYIDDKVCTVQELWGLLGISYDRFIRTTEEQHEMSVQKIFRKLYDQNDIYKHEYEAWHCPNCGNIWNEKQLADGRCPDCREEMQLTQGESYLFRLSRYRDRILKHIETNPDFIQSEEKRNEMLQILKNTTLEDFCISRTGLASGIPVKFDAEHKIHIWIDSLSNYISAIGYMSHNEHDYKKYWPADIHLVGKELMKFHSIVWPAVLMALGESLPKHIIGHGWLLFDGEKMPKTSSDVADPAILIKKYGVDAIRYYLLRELSFDSDRFFSEKSLINRVNSDLVIDLGNLVSRTIVMIEKYFNGLLPKVRNTGEYDEELIKIVTVTPEKVEKLLDKFQLSSALSEIWRTVSAINKYIDNTAPWVLAKDEANRTRLAGVLYNLAESIRIVSILLIPFMISTPEKIWQQLGIANDKDITSWESAKKWGCYPVSTHTVKGIIIFPQIKENDEVDVVENINSEKSSAFIQAEQVDFEDEFFILDDTGASANNPILETKIKKLNAEKDNKVCKRKDSKNDVHEDIQKDKPKNAPKNIPQNTQDDKSKITQEDKSKIAQEDGSEMLENGVISIEEFSKVDLRVARVIDAERIENADRLLKLKLDVNGEERQVVSGISKYYTPEGLIGKHVIFVSNLIPVKLRGIESQGMILAASDDNNFSLLTVDKMVESGTKVK